MLRIHIFITNKQEKKAEGFHYDIKSLQLPKFTDNLNGKDKTSIIKEGECLQITKSLGSMLQSDQSPIQSS